MAAIVTGVERIRRRAKAVIAEMRNKELKGLIKAQSELHKEMLSSPPTVPKEYGNLRKSYFCATSNGAIRVGSAPNFTDERKTAATLIADHVETITKAAADAVTRKEKIGPNIIFGFSAFYAWWVHEMADRGKKGQINWTTPGSGPKYFDTHVRRYRKRILRTVASEAKLPK